MLSLPKQKTKFWNDTVSYLLGDTKLTILLTKETKMKVNPIRDRILVKPASKESTTSGGIVLPGNASDNNPEQGEVLETGTGKILENGTVLPLTVKKGDKVLFGKFSGQKVRINNEEHLILSEDEIMAIVE